MTYDAKTISDAKSDEELDLSSSRDGRDFMNSSSSVLVEQKHVEKTIQAIKKLHGTVLNLKTISQNIEHLDISSDICNVLRSYCCRILSQDKLIPFQKAGAHAIHNFVCQIFIQLNQRYPELEESQISFMIEQWHEEIFKVYKLSRDLVNRIFPKIKKNNKKNSEPTLAVSERFNESNGNVFRPDTWVFEQKFLNRKINELEILLQSGVIQTYPGRVTVEPTSACNYRCTMCSHGHYETRPSDYEITDQSIERIAPLFDFLELIAVQVTGEPTLSMQLGIIVERASRCGVNIDMITNGSLLDKTNADISQLSSICFSFDGATKEVFEAQRVGAVFERVCRNIKEAQERSPLSDFELNVCVSRLNMGQLADIVRLAGKLGIARVRLNLLNTRDYPLTHRLHHLHDLSILGKSAKHDLGVFIAAAQEAAVENGIKLINQIPYDKISSKDPEITKSKSELLSILAGLKTSHSGVEVEETVRQLVSLNLPFIPDFFGYPNIDCNFPSECAYSDLPPLIDGQTVRDKYRELLSTAKSAHGTKIKLPYCTAPFKGGIIFAHGDYLPCCYMHQYGIYGNISEMPFEQIWNSTDMQDLRLSMFDDCRLLPVCRGCTGSQRYTFIIDLLHQAHRLGYKWEDIEFPGNFHPPARIKASIDQLQSELFSPGVAYELGTEIDFSESGHARRFMSSGFSVSGRGGVWNDGFESVLTLQLSEPVVSNLWLEIAMIPFLADGLLSRQRVEILGNGKTIGTWILDRPKLCQCHEQIDAALIDFDGQLQISFRFPDAVSWFNLGRKKNKSIRSVMFVKAKLNLASDLNSKQVAVLVGNNKSDAKNGLWEMRHGLFEKVKNGINYLRRRRPK